MPKVESWSHIHISGPTIYQSPSQYDLRCPHNYIQIHYKYIFEIKVDPNNKQIITTVTYWILYFLIIPCGIIILLDLGRRFMALMSLCVLHLPSQIRIYLPASPDMCNTFPVQCFISWLL